VTEVRGEHGCMTGYLIHIDGALTVEYDAVDPTVDKKLLGRLEAIGRDGGKIALITGRTEKWLDQHVLPLLNDGDFLVLGEYGNVTVWHNQRYWDTKAEEFEKRYRDVLKERIAAIAKDHGIRVKKDDRDYEPKSGELWFAPGAGVLSVRTNPHGYRFGMKVDADLVYKITKQAVKESGVREDEFDVRKTPVSTVVSRKGVNLENATRMAINTLDPEDDLDQWYAFGRSMDESMAYDPKIQFVCVDPKASKGTWDFLTKLK
jgi:hypothetical protein